MSPRDATYHHSLIPFLSGVVDYCEQDEGDAKGAEDGGGHHHAAKRLLCPSRLADHVAGDPKADREGQEHHATAESPAGAILWWLGRPLCDLTHQHGIQLLALLQGLRNQLVGRLFRSFSEPDGDQNNGCQKAKE